MDNIHLEPCPMCGGKAFVDGFSQSIDTFNATIVCGACGLRLEWEQAFAVGRNLNGSTLRVPLNLSPWDAWNRRVNHGGV